MTKKLLKEILGDCYIDITNKNLNISNERFYRAINKFINRPMPYCMAFGCDSLNNNWSISNNIREFLMMNPDYHLLNGHYMIDQGLSYSFNYKYAAICEKDGVKQVIYFSYPKIRFLNETYNQVPNSYIKSLYVGIVYNVVDLKLRFRAIKESISLIDDLKNKCFYHDDGKISYIKRFNITKVDKNNLTISIVEKTTKISLDDMKHRTNSRTTTLYGLTNFKDFIKKYKSFKPIGGIGDELRNNTNILIQKSLNRRSREILALKKKVIDMKII